MGNQVAIFGGGVAGLSAAHELCSRGFAVTVYEKRPRLGGKAASQVATTKTGLALPGEHGFRFFPGFYRNVIATLDEIPRPGGGVVGEDLVPSANAGIVWNGALHPFPRRFESPTADVFARVRSLVGALDFTPTDLARMTWFRLKYLLAGPKRRESYDAVTWWDFIEGASPHYSSGFREFERSIPRTMSAMVAETSSAKVIGDITMQFLLGYGRVGNEEDRLFVGPTTERWLEPWKAHLAAQGVVFATDAELDRFHVAKSGNGTEIAYATVKTGKAAKNVTADHYVAALPIDVMKAQVAKEPLLAADPGLDALALGPKSTASMVGVQLYLAKDEPMVGGHVFYPRSPWALTSVSQAQFWAESGVPLEASHGAGVVRGLLSVIVSDWDTASPASGLPAADYASPDALLDEVVRQLDAELGGSVDLSSANVVHRHLDDEVSLAPFANRSELLVHPVGGLASRPSAKTAIGRLTLCGDYVRTSTSLATMESANEAARRAVNAVLDADGSAHVRCPVWELREEPAFDLAKEIDDLRWQQGRPHLMDELPIELAKDVPGLLDLVQDVLTSSSALLSVI